MEKKYENGERVYLEVTVNEANPGNGYDYTVLWKDHVDGVACMASVGEENLFSMESCIDWQAKYNEYNEKAEAKIRELATRLNDTAESLREAQAKAVSLNSALKEQNNANLELEDKNALQARKVRELEEKLSNGKGDVEHWRKKYMNMNATSNEYKRFVSNVEAERDYAKKELALTKIMNVALAEKIERLQNG